LLKIIQLITTIGVAVATIALTDSVLPKRTIAGRVISVLRGEEGGGVKHGGKAFTHYRVHATENEPFPVFIGDYEKFNPGDDLIISYTYVLNNQTYILNSSNGFSTIPAIGLNSYYFSVLILLIISCSHGVVHWGNPQKHHHSTPFTLFLAGFIFFLL
jgi:hypothetical protein